jgi:glycosyltransferase involved in cell wall biosynthesis
MTRPLVSVIVPTHNSAHFLRQTLQSVFAQSFTDYEVVVVDDASTDNTRELVRSLEWPVRLIERSRNSGTADIPRYEGVEAAQGRYGAFLDADDLWLPDKLQKQVDFLAANPDVPLVHSYVMVMDAHGHDLYVRHEGNIPPTGMIAHQLLQHCFISTSSVMVRCETWLQAQQREDITGYGTEWDFFLAIARKHPVGFIPEVLAKYRKHSGSVSRQNWKRAPRDVVAKERIFRKGLWQGIVSRKEYVDILVEACSENSQYWRDQGKPLRAAFFAAKGLRYAPTSAGLWRHLAAALFRGVVRRTVAP